MTETLYAGPRVRLTRTERADGIAFEVWCLDSGTGVWQLHERTRASLTDLRARIDAVRHALETVSTVEAWT